MPITAASIEASGWVLRLSVSASLGSFASYTLDPDGTPRVVVTSSHAGFAPSGGQAIATNLARTMIATKPLRRPVPVNGPTTPIIDELDLGGGLIQVRIALSEHVYASDTNVVLNAAAGWRAGEVAASGIAVTNNSTTVAPLPIMRWALVPYGVATGQVALALFVASHHPVGLQPAAAVRFTVTDGLTTKAFWTTALSTDNSLGDNLRCYTASIDPATATALTAGLLRCDAEVYPWLGSMRTTDPLGTRSMASLCTDGWSVNAASPFVIGYDPANLRYGQQFALVDPVNGTTTAAAAMVATTLAGARAIAPAARPRDIVTALQAGYLANRTLAAANGQTAQSRSIDGMQVVLAAGTHVMGTGSATTGLATAEIPVRIVGDPADGNPRANCVVATSAAGNVRANRWFFQNLAIDMGTTAFPSGVVYSHFDNCTLRGKIGQESNTVAPVTVAPPAGQWNLALTRSRWWRFEASRLSRRLQLVRRSRYYEQDNEQVFA